MPNPNGTAVVMKVQSTWELEQHLHSLSKELNANLFEIVPVQLNLCSASVQKTKLAQKHQKYKKKLENIKNESS